jgi:hypothetical protein
MKKEITLGQFLSIITGLLVIVIGWGVSVEVRLATSQTQTDVLINTLSKMDKMVTEIHEQVIRHDEKLKKKEFKPFATRGGLID